MRRAARGLLALSAVTGMLVAAGCGSSGSSSTPTSTSGGAAVDFAGPVDIGDGREIYLECSGSGSPTVILESGYHDNAVLWSTDEPNPPSVGPAVFRGIGATNRVCAYDRPGTLDYTNSPPALTTRSTPVPMPRTAGDVVADLHALLEAAEVPGPYLLVPHSLGGLFARLYAQTYPDDVVGLVLVDTFSTRMPELLGEAWPAYSQLLNQPGTAEDTKRGFEVIDIATSLDQLAAKPPIPQDKPLIVLSKTEPFPLPEESIGFSSEQLETAWVTAQADLTNLAPNTPQTLATGSDHYIQVRDPDIVISAVRLIADRAADG